MADDTVLVASDDGSQYSIPNTPESIQDAIDKGYKPLSAVPQNLNIKPLIEQAAFPATAPGFQAEAASKQAPGLSDLDVLKDNTVRVFSDQGEEYHIPNTPESVADAKQKGYHLTSEALQQAGEAKKAATYEEKYAKQLEQPQGGTEPLFVARTIQKLGLTEDPLAKTDLRDDGPYADIPREFREELHHAEVPASDYRAAYQGMQAALGQKPLKAIQFELQKPEVLASLAAAGPAEELAIPKALARAKGVVPALGRIAIRGAVDTTLFQPEDIKNVIVGNDRGQSAENLLKGQLINMGLHGLGSGVGKVNELLSSSAEKGGLYDVLGRIKAAIGGADAADVEAGKILDYLGADQKSINDLTVAQGGDKLDTTKVLTQLDETLGKMTDLTRAEKGRQILEMGEKAQNTIQELTSKLDEISKPNSKLAIPEAHDLKALEPTTEAKFTDDFLRDKYAELVSDGKVALPYDDWKATSAASGDVATLKAEASKMIEGIKVGKINEPDFINNKLETVFNREFHPDYTATKNPEEFSNWKENESDAKATRAAAKLQYDNVKGLSQSETEMRKAITGNSNYDGRADAGAILNKLDSVLETSRGAVYENDIKQASNLVEKLADEQGKISPSGMAELSDHFAGLVKEGNTTAENALKKQILDIVNQEKTAAEARIVAGANDQELLAKLGKPSKERQVAKLLNDGKNLMNVNGQDQLDIATGTVHGGIARGALHAGGGLVGAGIGYALGTTPEEKRKYAALGGLATFGAMAGMKVFKNYWVKKGSYVLARSVLKTVAGENMVTHLVMDGAVKQQELVLKVPTVLAAVASKKIDKDAQKEKEQFNGLKALLGDEANGLSVPQQYARVMQKLSDPSLQQNQINIGAAAGENLAGSIVQTMGAMHQALLKAISPIMATATNKPFTKETPVSPSQKMINDFNDVVRLVNDPAELLKDFQDHTITKDKVALIQKVFPASYANMTQAALMEAKNIHLDLQDRMLLSILCNNHIDKCLDNVQALQAVAAVPTSQQPQPAVGGKTRTHKGSKAGAASTATPNQKSLYDLK